MSENRAAPAAAKVRACVRRGGGAACRQLSSLVCRLDPRHSRDQGAAKPKAGGGKAPLGENRAGGSSKTIEETYQKLSQLEHILLRPDTYIGSVEKEENQLWVHDGERMVFKRVAYAPGLYKIFDEILVNAADNKVRDPSMDMLKVDIDVVRRQGRGGGRRWGARGQGGRAAARAAVGDESARSRLPCAPVRGERQARRAMPPPSGARVHPGAQQRCGHPRGGAQDGGHLRARAHLWQPAHLLQLQRCGEEGARAGQQRERRHQQQHCGGGSHWCWHAQPRARPPTPPTRLRRPRAGATAMAPSWQTSSPPSLWWRPAMASAGGATSRPSPRT